MGTSAYCQAKKRLSFKGLSRLFLDSRDKARYTLWNNLRVKIVDGTTLLAPDTPENQKKFPQNIRQKEGLGFPIMRVVGIFCLSTGTLLNYRIGRYSGKGQGETSLFRRMLSTLNSEDLI